MIYVVGLEVWSSNLGAAQGPGGRSRPDLAQKIGAHECRGMRRVLKILHAPIAAQIDLTLQGLLACHA